MTMEEIKEILAETGRMIQASQARADQQMQELRDQEAASQAREAASQARADQDMQELRHVVKRTTKQLGELGNRLGGITEGLLLPSVRKILEEELDMETVINASGHRNGDSFQFDAVGYTNGGRNAACVVEVKSHLREEGLQQLLKHLRTFGDFFPEHKDKTLYGMLAAIEVNEDIEKRVLRQGIY
ncbi:MAG: DUF3782 domain-containing protein, partial [bacterium]|nr:DUF3782 domain-containing protein [bacterium]